MPGNHREDETRAVIDHVAITVLTDIIDVDMTRVARVREKRIGATTGHRRGKSGPIGHDRHHEESGLTETGRQWDLDHQNHGEIETDMIGIDKSHEVGQLLIIAKYI